MNRTIRFAAAALLVCAGVTAVHAEDAVEARAAIERVYWQDRDWPADNPQPRPPFEATLSEELLRADWQRTLVQRELLRSRWGIEIDGEMLQRELHRMAHTTRDADRLRRLFAALDDDAERAALYLAQPLLVDRLIVAAFAADREIHAATRQAIPEVLRGELTLAEFAGLADDARTFEWARPARTRSEATVLPGEEFDRLVESLKSDLGVDTLAAGQVSPLIEDDHAFRRFAVESADGDTVRTIVRSWPKQRLDDWIDEQGEIEIRTAEVAAPSGGYVLPVPRGEASFDATRAGGCTDDSWRGPLQQQPLARVYHTAVWTGSEMIVWGGYRQGFNELDSGGRYDPATDSWLPTTRIGAPGARGDHTAVWTGSEMLVWGSSNANDGGGRYNPTTDSWAPITLANAPSQRSQHVAVWTGSEMLIWGGWEFDAGRYDPSTDSWSAMNSGGLEPLPNSHAFWTGSEMIVWIGGDDEYEPMSEGARYNPTTDGWTNLPFFPQSERVYDTAVWSGSEMIVWGGYSIFYDEETEEEIETFHNTGARYNPVTNSWSSIFGPDIAYFAESVWTGSGMYIYGGDVTSNLSQIYDPVSDTFSGTTLVGNTVGDRTGHTLVWTGSEAIVWGGANPFSFQFQDSGNRYDPVAGSWAPVASTPIAEPRMLHTSVWTGSEMLVFGGRGPQTLEQPARYDPATDSWTSMSTTNAPVTRQSHAGVWTGSEMLVWGGFDSAALGDGGRYDPLTDSWTTMTAVGAPSARSTPAYAWSGSELLIWGGALTSPVGLGDGARYDPSSDSWAPIAATNAPSPRTGPVNVWTGSELIVWGGTDGASQLGDGARYDPVADSWTTISSVGAPAARGSAAEQWTGSEMLVWGGFGGGGTFADGAHYDPLTDSWQPMGTSGAPAARSGHRSVWTGDEYILFGGRFGSIYYDDGARYDPATQGWTPISAAGAPTGRQSHTAVWSGEEMIVFGGRSSGTNYNIDHGAYCAASSSCTILDWYADVDGDGVGDAGDVQQACTQPSGYVAAPGDCDDANANAFAIPGETESMLLSHAAGVTTIAWSAPSSPGGTTVSYDLLATSDASDFGAAACLQSQGATLSTTDGATPAAGSVRFYLSRATNACPGSPGSLGFRSDLTERSGVSCP